MFMAQTATVSLPNNKQIKAHTERNPGGKGRKEREKERKKGIPNTVVQLTTAITPVLSRKGGLKKKKKKKKKATKTEKEENKKLVITA